MNAKTDPIESSLVTLEQALAWKPDGREAVWARQMDRALADVGQAVQQRDADLKLHGGQLVDLDRPLLPSPTMDRLANGLRHELDGVLEEVGSLRRQAWDRTCDHGAFRDRVTRLLDVVRNFEHHEGAMIQEAVNIDIGGGD